MAKQDKPTKQDKSKKKHAKALESKAAPVPETSAPQAAAPEVPVQEAARLDPDSTTAAAPQSAPQPAAAASAPQPATGASASEPAAAPAPCDQSHAPSPDAAAALDGPAPEAPALRPKATPFPEPAVAASTPCDQLPATCEAATPAPQPLDRAPETPETPAPLQDAVADYLIATAQRSVDAENDRGRAIGSYSSRLLVGVSVLALAALGVGVPATLALAPGWRAVLMVCLFSGVLIPLVAAFLLAVVAGAGQTSAIAGVPQDLFSQPPVTSKMQLAQRICEAEQHRFATAQRRHNRQAAVLKAARILLLVASGFFCVALGFLCVIMIGGVA